MTNTLRRSGPTVSSLCQDFNDETPLAHYRDHPLLTRPEERMLFHLLIPPRAALQVLAATGDIAVALPWAALHIAVSHCIAEHNMRLVFAIASEYTDRTNTMSFDDLAHEGTLGLLRAIVKFEVERGWKFSTYSSWWIRQAITRSLIERGRAIRLPVHLHESSSQIKRTEERLALSLHYDPSDAEIADAMGKSVAWVRRVREATRQTAVLSLETPLSSENGEGDRLLLDVVPDRDDAYAGVDRDLIRQQVREMLDAFGSNGQPLLDERQKQVLALRYGLDDGQQRTLEEVGVVLGVTRERARQIEAEALRALRALAVQMELDRA